MSIARTTRISTALALVAGGVLVPATAASAADPCETEPRLSGTFVQPALIDGWTNGQLDDEFEHLDDACIDTHILQWTADSGTGTAIYDSGLAGITQSTSTDVIDRLLDYAESWDKSVIVGLQVNQEWFTKGVSDLAWLDDEASFAKDLADELYDWYGGYDSFDGWYLPFEVDNLNFPTSTQWDRLGAFYGDVIDHLHTISPGLPVVVAPFYNDGLGGTIPPATWEEMWESILGDAAIDVIALQDGVGAGHAAVGDLADWFSATRDAIDTARPATQLISDTETFVFGPSGLQPMALSGVIADLDAVSAYVDGHWAFAYDHYQSPLSVPAVYHATYLDYLANGVLDSSAPGTPTSLAATVSGSQVIDLSWTAPGDNVGIAGYQIFRGGSLVAIKHGAASGWSDSQLDGSTSYSYTIKAFDAAGNLSAATSSASATTGAAPSYSNTWSSSKAYTSTVAANASYPDTGGTELTDGVRGSALYGAAWQGRNAPGAYSFTVDLGTSRSIGMVETGWLQVRGDYVFLPPSVTIETSSNGTTWTVRGTITTPPVTDALQVKSYRLLGISATARYVRVTIDGGSAWTMLDEILVKG
ncbi:MAG: DUF4434 domain-containing protein [Microbacteriaceae bacterium]|nr:DUF4434 domain-containing protein [Microbacteriaceae bacterium]